VGSDPRGKFHARLLNAQLQCLRRLPVRDLCVDLYGGALVSHRVNRATAGAETAA
jgi:hypothetical protein